MTSSQHHPIIASGVEVKIQAAEPGGKDKVPRFSISPAYNGGPLQVGGYSTPIIVDLSGLSTNSQAVTATIAHDDERTVGHVTAVKNDLRSLSMDGVISFAGPDADSLLESSRRDFPWRASIEARPLEKPEMIRGNETVAVNGKVFSGPVLVARKAELHGVSFVLRGADENTSVTISAQQRRKSKMTKTTNKELVAETLDSILADAGLRTESARKYGKLIRAQALAGEITVEQATTRIIRAAQAGAELERIRTDRPVGPRVASAGRGGHQHAIQAAFLKHLGHETLGEKTLGAEAMEAGAAIRATSMMDIVKASLRYAGQDVPSTRDEMIRASFSTADLAGMLGNAANKLLMQSYLAVPSVARMVARKLSANDFKSHTGYRLVGDSSFEKLVPGGEIKHGTLSEQSYSFRVDTYARLFGLSRQDIINDDLGAFQSVPQIIGRGAATKLEEVFWALVLANTSSFFASGNGNYISGASTALSIDSLSSAVSYMRKQTDANGSPVMVVPRYLVVPPELEATADQLFSSTNIVVAGSSDIEIPDGNPHKNKYQPLVVPHLSNSSYSGYSETAWYLFGEPSDVSAFGIGYLSGNENPTVETDDAPFHMLGAQFRGYLDFGVAAIDHRGAVMSAGA